MLIGGLIRGPIRRLLRLLIRLRLALAQVKVYFLGGQFSVMGSLLIEVINHCSGLIGCGKIAIGGKKIVPRANINVETLFDKANIFIKLAAECSETTGIIGLECECRGRWLIIRSFQ